ncbi:MAG: ABC transporter permease [Dehalococcoidia bacterium]|nr:ABC transporter permease [Dehalococcoidia bacterium]MDW8120354.1 ABC transporter permease [Chloroflexota bacterium]
MRQYILRRMFYVVPTLFVVTIVVFLMLRFLPGDVVHQMLEGYAYAPTVEALRKELGLDRPILVQYATWISDIFRGDLGHSLWTKQPIVQEFARRFPVTLELAILTIIVSVVIGVGVGVISAIRQDSWADYLGRIFAIAMLAIPFFWLAVLVVVLPSIYLRWTPVWTYVSFTENPLENLKIMAIPALVFGLTRAGPVMRIMRSAMLEVMRQDYIRTAWAKGLSEQVIITRHALKNALIPVVSIIGIQMPFLIGGSVIIESIFRLPGVGQFFFEALIRRDYPVVQGINLILATFVILLNLAVDISYAYLDPRIRYR